MAQFSAGSLNLIPLISLIIQPGMCFDVLLAGTVSHLRSRFAYIPCKCGHAQRQGGRQPRRGEAPHVYRYPKISLKGGKPYGVKNSASTPNRRECIP